MNGVLLYSETAILHMFVMQHSKDCEGQGKCSLRNLERKKTPNAFHSIRGPDSSGTASMFFTAKTYLGR